MTNKQREICENLGWQIDEDEAEKFVDIRKYSPAGEDFFFTVATEDFVENVKEFALEFDPDEHSEMWVERRGKNGVPSSIRVLIDDADAIDGMLQELAEALEKAEDAA